MRFDSSSIFRLSLLMGILSLIIQPSLFGEEGANNQAPTHQTVSDTSPVVRFDLQSLSKPPQVFPADDLTAEGVKSFFYEGVPFKGHPTRVFAYYGLPAKNNEAPGKKLPAMVLIHGGGGSAFDRWVKVWTSRGYAAIAMDLCGCVPVGTYGNWKRHEHGGPSGWDASFDQIQDPIEDQWTYHAISAVILAHSLIRSYPEIDQDRIGVTGISWGGYLTCITAGVDPRFRFAVPVYGCGYLGENSAWLPAFEKMGPENANRWLKHWDPSVYLPQAKRPILWVNGTNDFAYPMDSWKKSYLLPKGSRELCLRVRMPHGHGPAGEDPEEIRVFADSFLKEGKPLIRIADQGRDGAQLWATYQSDVPVTKAELNYTVDTGRWQDRKWEQIPAMVDTGSKRVSAAIPEGATVFYLNLFDDRNCAVSTQHVEK